MGMTTCDMKMLYQIIHSFFIVYNFHLIQGDNYFNISSYFEAFEERYEIEEKTGRPFATETVCGIHILEMAGKKLQSIDSCKTLKSFNK